VACAPFDVSCGLGEGIGDIVSNAANDAVQQLTNHVLEGFGKALASIGTMWVSVPTPVLTAGQGTTAAGGAPPGSEAFTTVLSYVTYIGLVLVVLSLIGLGALIALRSRRGDGVRNAGALGVLLVAVLLISGASALVGALLGVAAPEQSSTTVGFLQGSLWFYVGGLAVLSVIVGGIRMAWEQRAHPGKELIQSLITLVVVSGTGIAVIGLATAAADAFSVWVLNEATNCDVSVAGESNCFGTNLAGLVAISTTSPIGMIGVLILGSIALLMTYVQVALMVVRGGLLVLLAGVLPLTASFTNTQMGRQWFGKAIGWTIAFILYKPAAALVYAAAFSLTGTDAFQDDGGGVWSILTGLALMLMALIALPALLRFVAPMTGAVAGAGSAGMATAAMAGAVGGELATGAIQRLSTNTSAMGRMGGGPAMGMPTGAAATGTGARTATRTAGAPSGATAPAARTAGGGTGVAAGGPVAPVLTGVRMAGTVAKGAATSARSAVRSAADDSTRTGELPEGGSR
jgi:type IV secretion system protein TrbL